MSTDSAHARNTDPGTRHAAAASVQDQSLLRQAILQVLREHGRMTDHVLWEEHIRPLSDDPRSAVHCVDSGCRGRRNELVELGYVRDSGYLDAGKTNREAIMWEATPERFILRQRSFQTNRAAVEREIRAATIVAEIYSVLVAHGLPEPALMAAYQPVCQIVQRRLQWPHVSQGEQNVGS